MDFKCFLCNEEFSNMKTVFKHLKIVHLLKDKSSSLQCVANSNCARCYQNFDGLRKHSEMCVKNKKFPQVNIHANKQFNY